MNMTCSGFGHSVSVGRHLRVLHPCPKLRCGRPMGKQMAQKSKLTAASLIKHDNAAFRKGTDITVSQLFFNTPARLKYMKTIQTELGHTIDFVNRLALSHPTIAFKLTHHSQCCYRHRGAEISVVCCPIYTV